MGQQSEEYRQTEGLYIIEKEEVGISKTFLESGSGR